MFIANAIDKLKEESRQLSHKWETALKSAITQLRSRQEISYSVNLEGTLSYLMTWEVCFLLATVRIWFQFRVSPMTIENTSQCWKKWAGGRYKVTGNFRDHGKMTEEKITQVGQWSSNSGIPRISWKAGVRVSRHCQLNWKRGRD